MDLFGPVNVMSLSRKRYALVIIDDFSKYTWVLFLNSKDETPKMIIDHIKRIELEANLPVRKIRSDNGTDFKNAILNEFCIDKGISRQFSAPRTPQQNGVVERKNMSLVEAARTMLNEAKLPLYFWAEVVNTACYTRNRTLINKDHNKTLYEIMANKKPTIKYFHVFGAKCFTLKDDEQLRKFKFKVHEGIFLGYSLESKAYRVYVIDHKKVIESMNVTFDDNKLPRIQDEDNTDTLKFDNMILEDGDTEEHEAAEDRQENDTNNDDTEPISGNDDGSSGNTSFERGSSSHQSSRSGGENEGSTNRTQQGNNNAESYRTNLPRERVWSRDYPWELIIGDPEAGVQTRRASQNECYFSDFLSEIEPKKVKEALEDLDWVIVMQE